MEVGDQLHVPAALHSGKETMISIGQETGWAPVNPNVGKLNYVQRKPSSVLPKRHLKYMDKIT